MADSVAPQLSAHELSVLIDFLLFGGTLACVAIFHRHALAAALAGLSAITIKKVLVDGFAEGAGVAGLYAHFAHEWVLIANLFLLLVGFALLARHFEASRIPDWMPAALPDNWTGSFILLVFVFVTSSALIGATVARHIFKGRVRIGYLAAIVAAANAGARAAFSVTRRPQCFGSRALVPFPCLMPMSRLRVRCSSRHPGIACSTEIRADRQGSAVRPAHRAQICCRGDHCALLGDRRQRRRHISSTPTLWTRSR